MFLKSNFACAYKISGRSETVYFFLSFCVPLALTQDISDKSKNSLEQNVLEIQPNFRTKSRDKVDYRRPSLFKGTQIRILFYFDR